MICRSFGKSGLGPRHHRHDYRHSHHDRRLFGLDTESMSPRARISAALSVLVAVGLSGMFLVAFVPGLWWIFTTYFWVAFPALGAFTSGVSELGKGRPARVTEEEKERALLEAIRDSGEISAAAAAVRTSLTVDEANSRLRELAENGHIEVRAKDGAVFYSLWATP